jgi:hypothetical protein
MANPTTKCLHSRLPQGWHVLTTFQRPGRCNIASPGVASIPILYLHPFHSVVTRRSCHAQCNAPSAFAKPTARQADSAPRPRFTHHFPLRRKGETGMMAHARSGSKPARMSHRATTSSARRVLRPTDQGAITVASPARRFAVSLLAPSSFFFRRAPLFAPQASRLIGRSSRLPPSSRGPTTMEDKSPHLPL